VCYRVGQFTRLLGLSKTMDREIRNGLIFALVSTVGYAGLPIFTKLIYQASAEIHPLDITTWRFAFAVPVMWLAVTLWSRAGLAAELPRPLPRIGLLVNGLFVFGAAVTAFYGLQYISASLYVVLFFTYPTMTGIIMSFLGHPLSVKGWGALVLTMIGIVLTAPDIFSLNPADGFMLGVWIALLNALLVALMMIINGWLMRGYPSSAYGSAWAITGTWLCIIPMLAVRGVMWPDSTTLWLLLVGLALFSTVMPVFSLLMAVHKLGASRTAIVSTVEVPMSVAVAFALLGDRLLPIQVIGGALIVVSVLILEWPSNPMRRRKPQAAASKDVG
jgi:drug/metabolite transporter (DMT)-like permease